MDFGGNLVDFCGNLLILKIMDVDCNLVDLRKSADFETYGF